MFNFFNKKIKENNSRGFTLVEMTIVGAIFGILTVIVVFKYGDFTSNLLVTNMAYEIALTARQAQAFSVGVRGYELEGTRTFDNPYGIFFILNESTEQGLSHSRSFIFFVDRDDNQMCGAGDDSATTCACAAGDECVEQYTLQRNIRITEIRLGRNTCEPEGDVSSAAVSFKRPSPEAIVVDPENPDEVYAFLQLKVEALNTSINPSYVLMRKNGQISVSGNNICE
jgi:prepilin-type N-terminal cleavage/methylation domain-containing protein